VEREPARGRLADDVSARNQTDQGGDEGGGKSPGASATPRQVVRGYRVFLTS
jgi:hypothetical protein